MRSLVKQLLSFLTTSFLYFFHQNTLGVALRDVFSGVWSSSVKIFVAGILCYTLCDDVKYMTSFDLTSRHIIHCCSKLVRLIRVLYGFSCRSHGLSGEGPHSGGRSSLLAGVSSGGSSSSPLCLLGASWFQIWTCFCR